MKRRLFINHAIIIAFSIALFVVFAGIIAQNNLNEITKHHLDNYMKTIQIHYEGYDNADELVDMYEIIEEDVRITVLNPEGMVVADSTQIPTDNHLSRPEFQKLGTIYTRHSDTLNTSMMYLAKSMYDGGYLRVAIPSASLLPFLNDFIIFSILIAIFILGVSFFLFSIATNKALVPLKETVTSLDLVAKGEYYDKLPLEKSEEINEIINSINSISKIIATTITELNLEKEKSNFILNHMDQGLCVLNSDKKISVMNHYLASLFHLQSESVIKKDYHFVFRDSTIVKLIDSIDDDTPTSIGIVSLPPRELSVSIAKITSSWNQQDVYLLIVNDITAMKQIETLKRDFFVNASHELKSPLTSIIGASDLISSQMTTNPKEIIELSQRILEEASRMNRLVQDMLSLSQFESNTILKQETVLDVEKLILDVIIKLRPIATKKSIAIDTHLESISLTADYEHIIQLVRNLIDNAIQYGIQGGYVIVNLFKTSEAIVFEVVDNGIGIPKEDQNRVFERFYRVDKARSKQTGGTGLGLAIVKHICALYHAEIHLISELNEGTKITISFPIIN
jgi:two-component system phosphate regulon sensor histidine kinase PhoR